jgi:predicted ester cyclase
LLSSPTCAGSRSKTLASTTLSDLGELGDPTGKRVQAMGMSHYHWKDGKIVDEWNVCYELSLLLQVKLGQLAEAS